MSIIPLPFYTPIFYNFLLVIVFGTCLKIITKGVSVKKVNYSAFILMLIVLFYMGLRPISGYFGDMSTYNSIFKEYQNGLASRMNKDIYWNLFMKSCSSIMSAKTFFFTCGALYIIPLYLACEKWFKGRMFIPFLMLIGSFSFWAYGTNGIRNGISTSFILYAFSQKDNKKKRYVFFVFSIMFHLSALIPIIAYLITLFIKKTKYYLYGWLLAIPLSLVLGSFWENLFGSIGIQDERVNYLIKGNINNDNFAYTGFRWDFVLYSASAIFAGYYFIQKRKFEDKIYKQLFNIYVVANAFWILIIRANFSNRFAYLSWFMIAIVIFYPFFKQRFFYKQNKRLTLIIILYYSFTYYMTF